MRVDLDVELRTASKDENAAKNKLKLSYPLLKKADVGVSGSGHVKTVLFNKTTSIVTLEQTFTVTKYFDSQVSRLPPIVLRISFQFSLPAL